MSATPWGDWMLAAARMGLSPDAFWRLSLREWRLMCAACGAASGLTRSGLEALAERYPDTVAAKENRDGDDPRR
jgi:uncharacterized phage protein (TIGR02216 family)